MRIVIAGATGVIGSRLVELLVGAGHEVVGLTRTAAKLGAIEGAGAHARVVDILDADALSEAIAAATPEVVMHQVTDLPDHQAALLFKVPALGRVRTQGTDNLVAAANAAGARVIAQSVGFPLPGFAQRAVDHLENAVLGADGVALRYGKFWGEGTWSMKAPKGGLALHIDTAAAQTVAAMDEPSGVLEVLDSGVTRIS